MVTWMNMELSISSGGSAILGLMLEAQEVIELIQGKLLTWTRELVQMMPNLVLAVVLVIGGWLLARLLRSLVQRMLARVTDSRTLQRLIGNTIYLAVIFTGLFAALTVLHLDKTVTSILAGAGIIGLALGFAFQDIAANFISGIIMAMQRPIRTGELVETAGHTGVVERIDLRTTEIKNLQGIQVIIPNKEIFQTVLVNYTRNGTRRVDLEVGISYAEDLEHVERVVIEAVEALSDRVPGTDVELFYKGFNDSSIGFEVRFWIKATSNGHFMDMRSRAVKAIKAAFNREGITIPFPIRTLDFGIKGGEKLDAMLSERHG